MELNKIIIILLVILIILVIMNHISINVTKTSNIQGKCSQTIYGCCPDGVNSKINFYGTNCPSYNPGPGYLPTVNNMIYSKSIGGCAGTRYGCCPNGITVKVDAIGSNCIVKHV